jgi:5-methylcytosine-specific restriction endonuclease McrA
MPSIEVIREQNRIRRRRYRLRHKDRVANFNKDWINKNPEKYSECHRQYRLRNKHKICARDMLRRALVKKSSVNLSKIMEWFQSVKSKPFSRCYYCDSVVSSKLIHFDHIIPLSKGGPHSVDNLCVSCAFCNHSKKDKFVVAWIRMGQQILAL